MLKEFLFTIGADLRVADWVLFAIFILFFIFGFGFLLAGRMHRNRVSAALLKRFAVGSITFGIIGAAWMALRYLTIPYLGTRFVATLILLCVVVWKVFLFRYIFTRFSREKETAEKEALKARYLKPKKR